MMDVRYRLCSWGISCPLRLSLRWRLVLGILYSNYTNHAIGAIARCTAPPLHASSWIAIPQVFHIQVVVSACEPDAGVIAERFGPDSQTI